MLELVGGIFKGLLQHYGAVRMLAIWADQDPDELKAYWAWKIGNPSPGALDYALANLPQFPPTVTEFREIMNRYRPAITTPLLSSPKNDEHGRARIAAIARQYGSKGRL